MKAAAGLAARMRFCSWTRRGCLCSTVWLVNTTLLTRPGGYNRESFSLPSPEWGWRFTQEWALTPSPSSLPVPLCTDTADPQHQRRHGQYYVPLSATATSWSEWPQHCSCLTSSSPIFSILLSSWDPELLHQKALSTSPIPNLLWNWCQWPSPVQTTDIYQALTIGQVLTSRFSERTVKKQSHTHTCNCEVSDNTDNHIMIQWGRVAHVTRGCRVGHDHSKPFCESIQVKSATPKRIWKSGKLTHFTMPTELYLFHTYYYFYIIMIIAYIPFLL